MCTTPVDLAIVLDVSGSVDKKELYLVKNFLATLVEAFNYGSQIALVEFAGKHQQNVAFNFARYAERDIMEVKGQFILFLPQIGPFLFG